MKRTCKYTVHFWSQVQAHMMSKPMFEISTEFAVSKYAASCTNARAQHEERYSADSWIVMRKQYLTFQHVFFPQKCTSKAECIKQHSYQSPMFVVAAALRLQPANAKMQCSTYSVHPGRNAIRSEKPLHLESKSTVNTAKRWLIRCRTSSLGSEQKKQENTAFQWFLGRGFRQAWTLLSSWLSSQPFHAPVC